MAWFSLGDYSRLLAELAQSHAALDLVSGAIVDAGTIPVPTDVMKYGEAVRTLQAFLAAQRKETNATTST